MQDLIKNGQTNDPVLRSIFLSEQINRRNNGALVAPWEVDDLPDEYVFAYRALATAARSAQQRQRVEGMFQKWRRAHPTYRKY